METSIRVRRIAADEHEIMSLLTARLFLDTIPVSYQGYCTPENLAGRDVWGEAKECDEWLRTAGGRMIVASDDERLVGYAAYCSNHGRPADHD
ncbi:MAG: hypothetical protein Q8P31_01525 [Bacillota bacterium]|nr:hypothetical protein [Bacillota bacterium]